MSQSRVNEDDRPEGLGDAHEQLSLMMNQGRSFSGRERNCVFLNTGADPRGEGRFACMSGVSGLDFPDDGRVISVVDWDQDGDQDLWIANRNGPRVRLLRNDTPRSNHYLALKLVGNGKTTNRDAIGARVEVWTASDSSLKGTESSPATNPIISSVRSGEGFLAQSSKLVHVGLGNAPTISRVVVHWPGGTPQELTGLQINSRYRVEQDREPELLDAITPPKPLIASAMTKATSGDRYRVPLVPLLRFPEVVVTDSHGNAETVVIGQGSPLLINCWSTTCKPCLKELREFASQQEAIRSAGLRVLAVSVDGVTDTSAAEALLDRQGFPFERGYVTADTARLFNLIHNSVTAAAHELPVPTSFLIDEAGRLSVIYKGPVAVDQILTDLSHSSKSRLDRFSAASPIGGRTASHEITKELIDQGIWLVRLSFAHSLASHGRVSDAITQYQDLLKEKFNLPSTHAILGALYAKQGNTTSAIHHYRAALDLGNKSPQAHRALAQLLDNEGRLDEALAVYTALLEIQPDDARSHFMLGTLYDRQRRFDDAQRHYERSIALDADFLKVRSKLAVILAGKKRWRDAELQLAHVARGRPDDPKVHYNLGVVLSKQNRWQQAMSAFQSAIDLKPDFKQAHVNLQRIQKQLNAPPSGPTPHSDEGALNRRESTFQYAPSRVAPSRVAPFPIIIDKLALETLRHPDPRQISRMGYRLLNHVPNPSREVT